MKNKKFFMSHLKFLIKDLATSQKGAAAIIFAVCLIPIVVASGMAVDLSRAYMAKQRLSFAIDAAGLAVGAVAKEKTSAELDVIFDKYMDANYPASRLGTLQNLSYTVTESEVTVSGQSVVPTAFMRILGINSLTVSTNATFVIETTGLELVMVLDNTGSMAGSQLTSLKSAASDLVDILFGNETNPTTLKIGLVPFSGSVNIGSANTSYISDPGYDWGTTSWGGCVMAQTYPGDVQDSYTGPWTPFYWPDHDSYNNWIASDSSYNITSYKGPNDECPQALTPLTNSKTTLETQINNMVANGYTHINYGAIWGWRVISPSEPFTEGVAYGTADWNKAVIILTDGDNTTSNSHYTAYQYRSDGILGSTTSSGTTSELDDRLTEVCTAMKALDIVVYTITFNVSSLSTQALFENCATDSSKYFNSPSSAELTTAFRAIGAELKNLYISQ